MGVSPEERIEPNEDFLTLYLIEYADDSGHISSISSSTEDHVVTASPLSRRLSLKKIRSNSFDLRFLQNEIRQKQDEFRIKFCTIL